MGAIAEAFVAFAQPLLDQTDGSQEQLNKAFSISQLCFNLALLPEDGRDQFLSEMRLSLEMDDEEFNDFRSSIIECPNATLRQIEIFSAIQDSKCLLHSVLAEDLFGKREM